MAELDILKILARDTIDVEAVEETLKYASVRNFRNLYDIQRSIVGVQRFDVPINDLVRITRLSVESYNTHYPHRYGYTITGSIVSDEAKKKCKSLGLYGKALSQEALSGYKDFITHNFLLFIDGKFIDTAELVLGDSEVTVVLDINPGDDAKEELHDGIPMDDYRDYCERNCMVTIFLVPNFYCGIAEFNLATFEMVLKRTIPTKRFDNVNGFDSMKTIFYTNATITDKSTMLGLHCDVDPETKAVTVAEDVTFTTNRLKFTAITLDSIYEIKVIEPGEDLWFMTDDEKYNTPLPVENIIPFVERDGALVFDNEVTMELYYPNIYHVLNTKPEDRVWLYILYSDSVDAKYDNDLAILRLLSGDLLSRYKIDSLPEFVKNYMPSNITWFDKEEFCSSIYYPDRVLYNIDALANYVLTDKNILLKYLHYRLDYVPRYYVNIAKLNLEDRVRTDTYKECNETGEIVFFDEPNYVFSMKRRYSGDYFGTDFRIFIDGRFINPKLYAFITTMDFYHFYIPTKLIKEDSVIELERYREYNFTRPLNVDTYNKFVTIEIPKKIGRIYTHDIVVVDETTRIYLDPAQYTVMAYSDVVDKEIEVMGGQYSIIKDYFKICLTDLAPDLSHKFKIIVDHTMTTRTFDLDVDNYEFPLTINIPNYKCVQEHDVRAFSGNVLLPEEAYSINNNGMHLRDADVSFYVDFEEVTTENFTHVTIDELPTSIHREFKLDYIDNEYGFVDTGDKLSLPLDLKWYDIYLNGVKLNKYNVDIITSNKFFVKNVESRRNLYIYARGDIYDEFNFIHSQNLENKLFDDIDQIYKDLIIDRDVIKDTLTDITEGLLLELGRINEFVQDVLQYIFINPNEMQIDEDIQREYADLLDEYDILWLDTNTNPDALMKVMINSNRRDTIMKKGQYRYGFTPLHIGSHSDARNGEYLCDPVTGDPGMKDADGSIISTGILNRLNSHKDRFGDLLASYNLQNMSIYHVEPTQNTHAIVVTKDSALIEEPIELDGIVKKFMLSIDMDVLEKGYQDVMQHSSYMPRVEIGYKTASNPDAVNVTITTLDDLNNSFILLTRDPLISIDHITLLPETNEDTDTMDNVKCVLHSVLVAF